MKKKVLAMILLAAVSVGTFISCSDGNESKIASNDKVTEKSENKGTEEKSEEDKLGWGKKGNECTPEELHSRVNKALKNRDLTVFEYNELRDLSVATESGSDEPLIDRELGLEWNLMGQVEEHQGEERLNIQITYYYTDEPELESIPNVDLNKSDVGRMIKDITSEEVDFTEVNEMIMKDLEKIFPEKVHTYEFKPFEIEVNGFNILVKRNQGLDGFFVRITT